MLTDPVRGQCAAYWPTGAAGLSIDGIFPLGYAVALG